MPNWRQIVGGAVGVTLLGTIGYFGQGRIRTNSESGNSKAEISHSKSSKSTNSPEPSNPGIDRESPDPDFSGSNTSKKIKVDISGEIAKPGVYELDEGQRIQDLVKMAGGFKSTADRKRVNLARKLRDEAKVNIPRSGTERSAPVTPLPGEIGIDEENKEDDLPINTTLTRSGVSKPSVKPSKKVAPSSPVNINSASEKELATVPGIGPAMAKRIVEFRSANGEFLKIQDIEKVKGLSGKVFEKIRPWITL